jgi:predicted dehydrogenase
LALLARPARAGSPSERVRVAVIGLRNRGTDLAKEFARSPNAQVVALCDIDESMVGKPRSAVEQIAGKAPKVEQDFRRLLDDKTIDAIAVATPDHWHALLTVMGCQAGKDVYCEKPASHGVVEGRRMVEAARKYDRVVQLGTQRRSTDWVGEAVDHVRSGALGKVGMVRTWTHQKRVNIGRGQTGPVPAGVDYALWQGPAPDRPFMPNRFHYNWHWFWNWGTGELGNNGVHGVDVARWAMGVDAPLTVASSGGKYLFDDDQETPDTQIVTWEFATAALVCEHRLWSNQGLEGDKFGVVFYGEKGTLVVGAKGWRVDNPDGGPALRPSSGNGSTPTGLHVENFLDCVRTRKRPNADIEIGHLSTRLCHLGNIAHRVGRKLTFDPSREAFRHDGEADTLLAREYGPRFEMPSHV